MNQKATGEARPLTACSGSGPERLIPLLIVATGVSSVVTQIVTIREFLSQFQGNEIVIALILFNWLIAGALGTSASHWIRRVFSPSAQALALLSMLTAALCALLVPFIRVLRHDLFIHGASVGFYPTWLFSLFLTLPVCTLIGFLLPYSLFVLRQTTAHGYPGAKVYVLDNIGDTLGGLIFSLVLVFVFTPVRSVVVANLPLLAIAFLLAYRDCKARQGEGKAMFGACLASAAAGVMAVLCADAWALDMEMPTLEQDYGRIVHYVESKFGRVVITENNGQYTLIEDGVPVFSSENRPLAEESVHFLLSQIRDPRRVLIISAQGGMIREIEKYHVTQIDYVELDPEVTGPVFRYGLLEDAPCVNVIHQDGRTWLQRTSRSYDAIMINLPEPDTFQLNRFYTLEFMRLVKKRLSPRGGFCFSVRGYDSYVGGPELEKISSLYNTATQCFRNVIIIPGLRVFFICSDRRLDPDIPALLRSRDIGTTWISNYFHGNIPDRRISHLMASLDPHAPLNRDLAPGLIRIMFQQWFLKFGSSPVLFTSLLLGLTLIYIIRSGRHEFVIFSTGALAMGAETLVILTFQVFHGYVYFLVGLIITVFLSGLMPGALLAMRCRRHEKALSLLKYSDMSLAILMLVFVLWMRFAGEQTVPVLAFLVFGFMVSVLCGVQFPLVLQLQGDSSRAVAGIFSADIIGAGLGVLLVSLVLIPYGGFAQAGAGLAMLKVTSLAILHTFRS